MVKHKNLYEYRWTRINKKFTSNDGLLSFPISKLSRQFRTNVWQKKKKKIPTKIYVIYTIWNNESIITPNAPHIHARAAERIR